METSRRRAQLVGIIALVIAVHATLGWLFFATTHWLSIQRSLSQSLQIVVIEPTVVRRDSGAVEAPLGTHRNQGGHPTDMRLPRIPTPGAPAAPDNHAQDAPIDWSNELSRAAANAVPSDAAPAPKDFGFPHATTQPPKTEPFGWDRVHTQRVESIPGGGILIKLNDNCVLVLFPLPFAGCAMGKRKANGDLFKHMQEPTPAATADAP